MSPARRAAPDVPAPRLRVANDRPLRADGGWVVLWTIAARRTRSSFALDRAVGHARALGKPLVVLDALRCGHPRASDRLHAFVLDGWTSSATRPR